MWYDCRDDVQKSSPVGSRFAEGKVGILTHDAKVLRGTTGVQTPLWPPLVHTPGKNELALLKLQEVKFTSRTAVLDFGLLWLQVQYLVHTSIQIYPRKYWETSVRDTPKHMRIFRVGVAFEFKDFVVAFVTRDLVFQLKWAKTEGQLPYQDVNVFEQWNDYLQRVVNYLHKNEAALSKNKRQKLAVVAIREMRDVLGGMGIYSSCEVMFTAGLSPTLTVNDVFWNPSRLARLLEAIYCFMASAVEELCHHRPLFSRCIRKSMVAPTDFDRREFGKHLGVYGKETVFVSSRLADLVHKYHLGLAKKGQKEPFDVFEPTLLRRGLEMAGHLGHLIFGQEKWREWYPSAPAQPNDPLTVYYRKKGVSSICRLMFKPKTHLDLDGYDALFLDRKAMRARLLPTYTYREKTKTAVKKQIWSILPVWNQQVCFSLLSLSISQESRSFKQVVGIERKKMTFRYIIRGKDVAIGPLEYCGNAVVVKRGKGR
ncbi:hypothetical protein BV25DRAFT_1816348, partial [Artomyces pyxidatus]